MSRKLVISFPGGRGAEEPLLYFMAKHFENMDYEKVFVSHPISGNISIEALFENAEIQLSEINFDEYEDVVFIGKSLGTIVACQYREMHKINASLILLAPIEGTLPYIKADGNILLVSAGEMDRRLDTNVLQEVCVREGINFYIEPDVGHRMEVKGDLEKDLRIITNVMHHLQSD